MKPSRVPDSRTQENPAVTRPAPNKPTRCPWYFSPPFVLALLALTGPFGIPFVILSPAFSPAVKTLLSILALLIVLAPLYYGISLLESF
jgi:hypothetical protein